VIGEQDINSVRHKSKQTADLNKIFIAQKLLKNTFQGILRITKKLKQ
jgi:hypothetical protein